MPRSPSYWLCLLAASSLAAGCSDSDLKLVTSSKDLQPMLVADPVQVDFGQVRASQSASAAVTLTNIGAEDVDIDALIISGRTSFTITGTAPIGPLSPDESVDVLITYAPTSVDERATLLVESDDPAAPELGVPIRGDAAFPALTVTPSPVEFPGVDVGVPSSQTAVLENVGGDTLVVSGLLESGSQFSILAAPSLPLRLEPGDTGEVALGFSSDEPGSFAGELWVTSNAPSPNTSVPLLGFAGEGSLTGRICDPSGGGWVVGARVWVGADDDGDGTNDWEVEDFTDVDGRFTLDPVVFGSHTVHVEKGSWSTEFDVSVGGGTTELPEPECLDPGSARVAVVTGLYDDIGSILSGLGIDYDEYDGISDDYRRFLLDPDALAQYDILFLNCGTAETWLEDQDAIGANLADFVANGGSVYASDWDYGFVEASWPGAIDFYGGDDLWDPETFDGSRLDPYVGVTGRISATVLDATLSSELGTTASINYNLDCWVVPVGVGEGTSVLFEGDVPIYNLAFVVEGTQSGVPLAVLFTPSEGGGTVVYTSFHNEAETTPAMETALKEVILAL